MNNISSKLQKLEDARIRLKKEYVGIDSQIDKLIEYVTPWYCTPEILEKPVTIFLAGLTGNGKTSVVRKLLNFLEIDKQIYFDCGEEAASRDNNLTRKLKDNLTIGDSVIPDDNPYTLENDKIICSCTNNKTISFVFDEFQYCRSIDEDGKEIDRGSIRAIWNLIDSGVIDLTANSAEIRKQDEFSNLLETYKEAAENYPDIKLDNLVVTNHIKDLKKDQFWSVVNNCCYDYFYDEDDESESKSKNKIINFGALKFIKSTLDYKGKGTGKKFINELIECTTITDFVQLLDSIRKDILKPILLNCSKCIVFLLGNIDEAFGMHENLSPDIDADSYRELTSKVNITDIKNGLKKRLRIEQISRLGNNMIIYPSLGSKDFKEIILKELDKIKTKTEPFCGKINFSENIINLIYSESVYPAQGVRPTITSVYSLISPYISKIYLHLSMMTGDKKVSSILVDTAEDKFDSNNATIRIKYFTKTDDGSEVEFEAIDYKIELTLGKLHNTSNDKYNNIKAIHEASHTVAYAIRTGKIPNNIVSLTTDGGGFMEKNISSKLTDNISFKDVDDEVIVSLAGYVGEHTFWEKEKCTIGASSDFDNALTTLNEAIYKYGYAYPGKFIGESRNFDYSGMPNGFSDRQFSFNIYSNQCSLSIESFSKKKFEELLEITTKLINSEKVLINRLAIQLAKNRILKENDIKELINKYANTFSLESMKILREKYDNYELSLIDFPNSDNS